MGGVGGVGTVLNFYFRMTTFTHNCFDTCVNIKMCLDEWMCLNKCGYLHTTGKLDRYQDVNINGSFGCCLDM